MATLPWDKNPPEIMYPKWYVPPISLDEHLEISWLTVRENSNTVSYPPLPQPQSDPQIMKE
jgi:hypothetical protein